jgi:hypothetical protein
MAEAALPLTDLNERIQLAEGMVEDRRMLLADLEKSGHDTTILREMLHDTEQVLAELRAHRDRINNRDQAEK